MSPPVPRPETPPAKPRTLRAPIAIVGLPFDPVTMDDAVAWVSETVARRRPHYGVTANVDFVVQALGDAELRRIIFDAHLVLCDGMPIVWASRWLGNPLPERVAGSDLMPRLLGEAELKGWRVFLLGSTEESIQRAAGKARERHPGLNLCGAYSPPFRELMEMDHAELIDRIRQAHPDLLFVALGCPKQEKWINLNYRKLEVPFCLGIGASIDFLAGTQKRAPAWMQRTGLEWFYRVCQEPHRLARRYLRGFFVFGGALVRQLIQMRSARANLQAPPDAGAPPPTASPAPPVAGDEPLKAPVRLDAAATRDVETAWLQALGKRSRCSIDLSEATFIDSTGVGLLVRLQKTAARLGHSLVLLRPPPQLVRSLEMMRIASFFTIEGRAGESDPGESLSALAAGQLDWSGELAAGTVDDRRRSAEALLGRLDSGGSMTLDLGGVTYIDTSGVGVLTGLMRECQRFEVRLAIVNPSAPVRAMLRRVGLEEFLLRSPAPGSRSDSGVPVAKP